MAASRELEMAGFLFFVVVSLSVCSSHISDEKDVSSESLRPEQYEGIPIEIPRRSEDENTSVDYYLEAEPKPLNISNRRIYQSHGVASIKEFPFIAAILMHGKLICAGTIITWVKVVTTADCLQFMFNTHRLKDYKRMITVRVASVNATSGGRVLGLKKLHFHPHYNPDEYEYNLLVLELDGNVTAGNPKPIISPAKFPHRTFFHVSAKQKLWFVGWGTTTDNDQPEEVLLQKMWIPTIFNRSDCRQIYGDQRVPFTAFCAGWKNETRTVCNRDVGGPAIIKGGLGGILLFTPVKCTRPYYPAVFLSVLYPTIQEWLETQGIGTLPKQRLL